jgi:excisionase family DNA binding protein
MLPNVALVPPVADTSGDTPDSKKPRSVLAHRTGLELNTATSGEAMQEQGTRFYRVKAVAERYDVSPATIYRAIQAGDLEALKIGNTLRVPEWSLRIFESDAADKAANEVEAGTFADTMAADVATAGTDTSNDVQGEVA